MSDLSLPHSRTASRQREPNEDYRVRDRVRSVVGDTAPMVSKWNSRAAYLITVSRYPRADPTIVRRCRDETLDLLARVEDAQGQLERRLAAESQKVASDSRALDTCRALSSIRRVLRRASDAFTQLEQAR